MLEWHVLLRTPTTNNGNQFWVTKDSDDFYSISAKPFSVKNLPSFISVPLM